MIPLYIFAEKLLDMKPKTFVLSDESINSYGFRVLTAGIALDRFERNPIMLWNHTRSISDDSGTMLPIGKWANIRVEDGLLIADAIFDEKDEFAMKIAEKVEQGIINMASIGFVVNEESDKPELVLSGQTRKTVTKCTLLEVSIVDIGSNSNAVALYDKEGNIMELSAGGQCAVGLINNESKNESMDLKEIAKILGLKEDATEAAIKDKLIALNQERKDDAAKSRIRELEEKLRQLEAEKAAQEKKAITTLVDAAVREGKITADKKQHFVELGCKVGVDSLTETLSCMNPAIKPTDVIGHHSTTQKKFSEMNENELKELRDNNRTVYCELYRREFGIEPEF